jgi:hypothetical protein
MLLYWSIRNDFLHCAHFIFPIEIMLKFLEQIQIESSMNVKLIQTFSKNSGKFSLDLIFTKVNLVGHTCMQEFKLQKLYQKGLVWIKEKSLNLKFKPYNIYNTYHSCKDLIQAFKIHSVLLFKQCSCYSDTRGVTLS